MAELFIAELGMVDRFAFSLHVKWLNVGRQHLVANLEVLAGQRPESLHPVPSGGLQPVVFPGILQK